MDVLSALEFSPKKIEQQIKVVGIALPFFVETCMDLWIYSSPGLICYDNTVKPSHPDSRQHGHGSNVLHSIGDESNTTRTQKTNDRFQSLETHFTNKHICTVYTYVYCIMYIYICTHSWDISGWTIKASLRCHWNGGQEGEYPNGLISISGWCIIMMYPDICRFAYTWYGLICIYIHIYIYICSRFPVR